MRKTDLIRQRLEDTLHPLQLKIVDESLHHAGHEGMDPHGESHFRVEIMSRQFEGLSRVERHRKVYAALDGLFEEGLHALQIFTKTPNE
jgi:BolA family transcriptional regulator, general stress-responsive regulator